MISSTCFQQVKMIMSYDFRVYFGAYDFMQRLLFYHFGESGSYNRYSYLIVA